MKQKIALNIFIFSLIILIILASLTFLQNSKIIGEVIANIEEEQTTINEELCIDSDNGKDYSNKGETCNNNECIEDFCSGKKLTEYYCSDNKKLFQVYNCESECDDGACINLVTEYNYTYSGRGGSGGGSSGGSITTTTIAPISPTGQTHNLGELSEQTLEILKNDNIVFTISGIEYTLTLTDNTNIQATFNTPVEALNIMINEEKSIDLNSDGNNDIYINLKSINSITKKVSLRINFI